MRTNYIYPEFTKEMKKTHKILVPNALPVHFELTRAVMQAEGYQMELLNYTGQEVINTGLKYVHNDLCYPAIVVIGQLIYALECGDYDPHKTALMLYQTGGGCRASNYVHLLRKALKAAGFEYVPVISLNWGGIEKNSGFKVTPSLLQRGITSWAYGDLIMLLRNQIIPYEINKGQTRELVGKWTEKLAQEFRDNKYISTEKLKTNCAAIAQDFLNIPVDKTTPKPKVGIVGEIYVKYADFGNNHLFDYLVNQGAEVMVPGILGFLLYGLNVSFEQKDLYGDKHLIGLSKMLNMYIERLDEILRDTFKNNPEFAVPVSFTELKKIGRDNINLGVCMGEGWLLTAEMAELIEKGYPNLVCVQPFACLPNHIVGRGMFRQLNEKYEQANICAVDYDPGSTAVNQENRIKLMLAIARENMERFKSAEEK